METLEKLRKNGVILKYNDVERICKKYRLAELSVFGSSIRDDFHENSDVDILISFDKGSDSTIWDLLHIKEEFEGLLNRSVDVVEKEALRNPIRKKVILSTYETIYAYS